MTGVGGSVLEDKVLILALHVSKIEIILNMLASFVSTITTYPGALRTDVNRMELSNVRSPSLTLRQVEK